MNRFVTLLTAAAALTFAAPSMAQSDTAFTYQGSLADNGQPATGTYSVNFSLWDALSGGNEIGTANLFNTLAVDDGLFTVQLDFGADAFDNSSCWLEISFSRRLERRRRGLVQVQSRTTELSRRCLLIEPEPRSIF